jgi:SAM-dependent methyltransferase
MSDYENLQEYQNPELYDIENPDFEPVGLFYLSIARETGGPILELGCGTGRMTIPLAIQGFDITGLDIVPGMLDLARKKAGDLPIRWIEADARDFHLNKKFNFIFENGSVFMHMLTNSDQDEFLARVREHLNPGGRFVMSLFFPHLAQLESAPEEKEWYTYQDGQGRTVRVSGIEVYDEIRQIKNETAIRRMTASSGEEEVHVAPLLLRYTFPQEMERLLDCSGFKVIARYGEADHSELSENSPFMLYVCTLIG